MATTANVTLRCGYTLGFRTQTECDRCTVSVEILTAGVPSGVPLTIGVAPGSTTAPEMTQWHPGLFRYLTLGTALTRGLTYRATYSFYVGGTLAETQTEDFVCFSEDTASQDATLDLTYTTLGLQNVCRRALGLYVDDATPSNSQEPGSASSLEIVNNALEELWRRHKWTWQDSDRHFISFQKGVGVYELPADFLELISINRPANWDQRFARLDPGDLDRLREEGIFGGDFQTWYALRSGPSYAALPQPVRYILEIYPTPASFLQNACVIRYRRDYRKLQTSNSTTEIPQFPAGIFSLVQQAVRACAYEQEDDPRGAEARMKLEQMVAVAMGHDGRHQSPFLGSMIERTFAPDGRGFDRSVVNPDWTGTPLSA